MRSIITTLSVLFIVLFGTLEAVLSLTATNPEFKEIHRYYTGRKTNALKKKQSLMVLSNKLIRVFYAILKSGADYDPEKLLSDIRRPEELQQAA